MIKFLFNLIVKSFRLVAWLTGFILIVSVLVDPIKNLGSDFITFIVFMFLGYGIWRFVKRSRGKRLKKENNNSKSENNIDNDLESVVLKIIEIMNTKKDPELEAYKEEIQNLKQKVEKNDKEKSLTMVLNAIESINERKDAEIYAYKDEMQKLKQKIEKNEEEAKLEASKKKIEQTKEKTTVKCSNCAALNTVIVGEVCYCEFCGTPIKQN